MAESLPQRILGLKPSNILIPQSPTSKSFSLGPQSLEPPLDLISTETKRIPFVAQNPDPDRWTNQLRAWPFPMEGWVSWYKRVAKHYESSICHRIGIVDALSLTVSSLGGLSQDGIADALSLTLLSLGGVLQ
ncbi:hypothetical protein BS78_09G055400 [Paspalum vaginatum]|nr:hypothetical protein BS78_09G055400 [Paspalum vaginatum]